MKLHWIAFGGTDISGEWHKTSGYYAEIRRSYNKSYNFSPNFCYNKIPNKSYNLILKKSSNHNYFCALKPCSDFKYGEKGWRLYIRLGTYYVIKDILDKKFDYIRDAKQYAENFLDEFDKSEKAWEYINEWKKKKCKPVFDLDLNYIGDEYQGVSCCRTLEDRVINDYYNDNPVDYTGYTYTLVLYSGILNVMKNQCTSCVYGTHSIDNDEELKYVLLDKVQQLDNPYLERFKEYEREMHE